MHFRKEDQLKRQQARYRAIDADVLVPIRLDSHLENWSHERKADVLAKVYVDFSDWRDPDHFALALRRLTRALNPQSWA